MLCGGPSKIQKNGGKVCHLSFSKNNDRPMTISMTDDDVAVAVAVLLMMWETRDA
jgi:hypothetical protein